MGRSDIFWLITQSSCHNSSKRGFALFRVVASGAHALASVTVVARVVSTSASRGPARGGGLGDVTSAVCAACGGYTNRSLVRACCSEDAAPHHVENVCIYMYNVCISYVFNLSIYQ
jgi:hypothetical protein